VAAARKTGACSQWRRRRLETAGNGREHVSVVEGRRPDLAAARENARLVRSHVLELDSAYGVLVDDRRRRAALRFQTVADRVLRRRVVSRLAIARRRTDVGRRGRRRRRRQCAAGYQLAVRLHVLPERRRVGVGLVATGVATVVRFVGGVNV